MYMLTLQSVYGLDVEVRTGEPGRPKSTQRFFECSCCLRRPSDPVLLRHVRRNGGAETSESPQPRLG